MGTSCPHTFGDFFAQAREIPPVKEGDLIALMSAGAYGFSMASSLTMPTESWIA